MFLSLGKNRSLDEVVSFRVNGLGQDPEYGFFDVTIYCYSDNFYEAYLGCNQYGIKTLVFGEYKGSLRSFEEDLIPQLFDYIVDYKNEVN